MTSTRRILIPAVLLAVGSLSGCGGSGSPPGAWRPPPGSRVTLQLFLAEPWTAGETTPVHIRLAVEGQGTEPRDLQVGDVAEDQLPRVALTFFRGEEVLEHQAGLATKPDC